METLTRYFAVAAGSAVGGCLRYYLGTTTLGRALAPFPVATFVINITGSFIIGFFLTLAAERFQINLNSRLAIAVGFVGAYTTFSTFEYETARLVEDRRLMLALLNVILSVLVGFVAVWLGITAARKLAHRPAFSRAAYEQFERYHAAVDTAQSDAAERDIRDSMITTDEQEISEPHRSKQT